MYTKNQFNNTIQLEENKEIATVYRVTLVISDYILYTYYYYYYTDIINVLTTCPRKFQYLFSQV